MDFVIANGITVRSSAEDIKTAFGVPGYSNSGSEFESMTYYAQKESSYNSVNFYCSNDGKYSSITMKNFIETEDDKTTTNKEKPEYLGEYKVPVTMATNITGVFNAHSPAPSQKQKYFIRIMTMIRRQGRGLHLLRLIIIKHKRHLYRAIQLIHPQHSFL